MNNNYRLSPTKDVEYIVFSDIYNTFVGTFKQAICIDGNVENCNLQFDYPEYVDGNYFNGNMVIIKRHLITSLTIPTPASASVPPPPPSAAGGKTYKKYRSKRRITRKNRQTKKKTKSKRR